MGVAEKRTGRDDELRIEVGGGTEERGHREGRLYTVKTGAVGLSECHSVSCTNVMTNSLAKPLERFQRTVVWLW